MTSQLVFLDAGTKAMPFTTSEVIAEHAGIGRRAVDKLISTHTADFDEFGFLRFQIAKPQSGSAGGRPRKIYLLNEAQATLLMTFLRNTSRVVLFKKELVRQFFAMRAELEKRRNLREIGKPIRRSMTDAIKESREDERMHGHAYSTYTNLALHLATNQTASQLRKNRDETGKIVATDLLNSDELAKYQQKEAAIAILLDAGLRYHQIKSVFEDSSER